MLESLKQSGREIGVGINRAWRNSSEGWRELLHRSGEALTHFARPSRGQRGKSEEHLLDGFPQWGLLASEIEETDNEVLVHLEMPGLSKEDCTITTAANILCVTGEKRINRETSNSTYHLRERAYGSFQRVIPLPRNADTDKAQANYKNGVLSIRIPKFVGTIPKSIHVN